MHQDSVTIRFARNQDLTEICQIEQNCFVGDRLSRRSLRHLLVRGHCSFFVAVKNQEVMGYAIILYRRGNRLARLYSIGVLSTCWGQGIARSLLDAAENEARNMGCTDMRLEVRIDNTRALRLYQNLGYQWLRIKDGYYEDQQSAVCFEKALTQPKIDNSSNGQRGLAPNFNSSA